MGASASVLAGATVPAIKKASSSVSHAVVAVTPSAETRKFVKMYAKEGYRQVSHYTKRGLRTAARGLTIATTIARKLDVAGSSKRKAAIDAREAQRRKMLMAKKGLADDDDGMVETVTQDLVLVEGDEDERGSDDEERDAAEEDMFHDLFGGGAAQGEGAETFYKESTTDKLKKQIGRAREHTKSMRIKQARKVCEPKWMPEEKKKASEDQAQAQEPKTTAVHHLGMDVMAAVKIKGLLRKRRKERERNQFQASAETLKDVSLDAIDGTDVQGWNRAPQHSVIWSDLNVYIIRAYGDCQKEVNVLYTSVLPKIRQVLSSCAVNVQFRDLGSISRPLPEARPEEKRPQIGISLKSIKERNSVCIVLVGFDYGEPWKHTCGSETLKELGLDDSEEIEFAEEMSELEILATRAAQESEIKHTVFTSRMSVPRTFMYTCVDPDSPFRYQGGFSPTRVGGASPGGGSPGANQRTDGFKKAVGGPADRAVHAVHGASPVGGKSPKAHGVGAHGGRSPLKRDHGPESSLSALSPMKLLKKKKKAEEKRKKLKLAHLVKTVLPALVRNPDTGELQSPETTFQMIDQDGSGRVDKSEFSLGLELCGVEVDEEELELIWNHLDDDGGGDLDVHEMCAKLEELHKHITANEQKQASVMPRLVANKVQPLIFAKKYRMRVDTMKDFQDTAEKQEERWLIKFGKDVLEDLHGVCPIVALAAQEFQEKQLKLMESNTKIPPVPLNFHPDVPEYSGHETILLNAGNSEGEPMWQDSDVNQAKSEILDYIKGLSNWPMAVMGSESGSGKTSMLAQTCRDLRKAEPFNHILFHSVGGVTDSTEMSLFLYRMIAELIKRFEVRYHPPDLNLQTLIESFPKVLLKADIDSTLVLVIDNLDRLTKEGEPYLDLDWFPRTFPAQCRFIFSCSEGKLLNSIRRNRLQFGGSVELHEIMLPRILIRQKPTGGEMSGSESQDDSRPSTSASRATGPDAKRDADITEVGIVRALARSRLFNQSGLAISPQTTLADMVELLLGRAEAIYGPHLVRRYCLFVIISRHGILERDLYDLMNAAAQQRIILGDCRCSWQEFCCLRICLESMFLTMAFGYRELVVLKTDKLKASLLNYFSDETWQVEAHELCARHYLGQMAFLDGGSNWSGEFRRAMSEIPHHITCAGMWHELLEVVGNLRYIEARTSLGVHPTLALCSDYVNITTKTKAAEHWIKTEVLRVRDSLTMVNRYANQLYMHPRWVFGIGANLPDSSGVTQHAKQLWTVKKEVRPQLVWLNKPKVKDSCAICLQEPKIVWHEGRFSRDMRFLVTVGQDPRVFIWNPINGHIMYTFEGHTDEVMSIQFSWDDEYLLSASRDGSMILWKTPEEAPDRKAQEEEERDAASHGGFSRARSSHSHGHRPATARPKTGISFKSQNLNGFPDSFSRASSNASVKKPETAASDVKREPILKAKEPQPASGLKWRETGSEITKTGTEIKNPALARALQQKVEFSSDEVEKFKLGKISHDHYVKVGDKHFRPEEEEDGKHDSEEEKNLSRAASVSSSKASSVKRERVGIHNWYPIKPIVATIPAHRSTIWSCAYSMAFNSEAELHIPLQVDLGHNEFRIDQIVYDAYFLNFNSLAPLDPKRFPVKEKGIIKVTRLLTESERSDQRVKRKEEMTRQTRSTDGNITRVSSTGSKTKVYVDDFLDQADLAGKFVVITIPKEDPLQKAAAAFLRAPSDTIHRAAAAFKRATSLNKFERAPSLQRVPSFERATSSSGISIDNVTAVIQNLQKLNVKAIFIAMDEVEKFTEIKAQLPEIDCPIVCAKADTVAELKDGQEVTIRKKHQRGQYVASGSADHSVKIWDTTPAIDGRTQQLRRPVATLQKHKSYVSHVAFSHFGDMLVSSGGDFQVVLWNMKDFTIFAIYDEAMAPVTRSVWSPDDSMILSSCHDGFFRLFKVDDQETIKTSTGPHSGHLWAVAFSENQDQFVTVGHEGKVVLWDLEQMIEHNKEKTVLEGHHGPILSCAFSCDAKQIVTVSADRTVRAWKCDVDLFEYSLTYAHECLLERQAEQKKKAELKDILERSAKGWSNAGAAKVILEKMAHPLGIHVVVFSPSGEHLVTGSEDCQIIFWSINKQQATRTLNGHEAPIAAIKFVPSGEQLASGCNGGVIILWEVATGRRLHTFTEHSDHIRSLDFNRSGSRMVSSSDDRSVKLWCLDDPYAGLERTPGLTIYSDSEAESENESISNNGSVKAGGGHGDRDQTRTNGTKGSPSDSKKSNEKDDELKEGLTLEEQLKRARNQREGQVLFKAYDENQSLVMQSLRFDRVVYSVAYSPDSKSVVTGSADSLIRVFGYEDKNENALVERVMIPREGQDSKDIHRSFVKSVMFDRESRRILSSGVDGTIKLWSARNGLLLRTFVGHTQETKQVCISPDNKAVLSCSLDETCRMWNLDTGEELFQIKHNHCIFSVNFSVDGKFIATGAHDGEFKVWEKDQVDYEKKPLRGWPRIRELLRRIRRLRSSPIGLAQDGRRVCLISKVHMLDGKPEKVGEVKDETQWITVENMVTGARDYQFALPEPAEYCTINETGEMIIFGRGTRLRVFLHGEQTYSTTKAHNAGIRDMRLSEDGVFLATGSEDNNCRVWRPTEEGILVRVKTLKGHLSGVRCVCFSPNGRYLATGSSDLCVKLWTVETWKIAITFKAHTNFLTALAFDVDGEKLCTAGEDSTIRIWALSREITTRKPPVERVRIRHIPSPVLTCDFTECGTRVVGVTQGRHIYVWHALKGSIMCHWEFLPFDPDAYQNSVWRCALLSLHNTLNAVMVTDATGNTFKFVLMSVSKPKDQATLLAEFYK